MSETTPTPAGTDEVGDPKPPRRPGATAVRRANRREWARHRGHQRTWGQVFFHIAALAMTGTFGPIAWLTATDGLWPTVMEAWRAPISTGDKVTDLSIMAGLLLGIFLVVVGIACQSATLIWGKCAHVWRPTRLRLAAKVEAARKRRNGISTSAEALPAIVVMTATVLGVIYVVGGVGLGVTRSVPPLVWPFFGVALLLATILTFKMVVIDVITLPCVADGWALLTPPSWDPIRPSPPPPCRVCAGRALPRSAVARLRARLSSRSRRLARCAAERSPWAAAAYHHPVESILIGGLGVVLVVIDIANINTRTFVNLLTAYVTLLLLREAISPGPSMFDGLLEAGALRSILRMIGVTMIAIAVWVNTQAIFAAVTWLEVSLAPLLPDFDPDIAIIFIVALEGVILYAARAAVLRRCGIRTRWGARETLRATALTLVGLGVSAADGSWGFTLVMLLFQLFIGYTAPARRRWHRAAAVTAKSGASANTPADNSTSQPAFGKERSLP